MDGPRFDLEASMQDPLPAGVAVYEASESSVVPAGEESSSPAVSWGAILAGAFAAAALDLALIALGAGLGFWAVSPWAGAGMSAARVSTGAVIWMVIAQWLSAGVGGYMAGRLRTKWTGVHTDEVFFRDTAHGFLAWAVGVVLGTALLASAASSLVGNTAQAGATIASSAAQGATQAVASSFDPAYSVDALFRSDRPASGDTTASRAEVGRILTVSLRNGDLSPDDRHYLAQLVGDRTGLSPADADKRVGDWFAKAKATAADAADAARKAAAAFAFATCISMLVGAFVASVAGALGGRLRDENEGALNA
jgi:hypothetical protein